MNGSHVVNEYVQILLNQLTVTITISLLTLGKHTLWGLYGHCSHLSNYLLQIIS